MKKLINIASCAVCIAFFSLASCKDGANTQENNTTTQTTATETDTITQTASETPGVATDTVNAERDPVTP